MKQIVFVTGSMCRGGAERVISLLSNHYVKLGWNVSIVMLLHSYVEYDLDPKVEILDFSNDKIHAALDMPRLICKLRKFVKSIKPDVVAAFMAQNCMVTSFACRGLKTRIIQSERIDPAAVKRGKLFAAVLNDVYARSTVTVLQTLRAKNYFPKKVQDNAVVIPNPVAVKAEAAEQRKHRIVTAGRLAGQKNHKMLICAFDQIHKVHPEYTLDIYGEGPLREALQQQIDDLGLTAVVTLKGNVPNIHDQIADAEIFALTSNYEGLSNALLEAMMMGHACISTDCAGSDEVIRDGENGLLIPVGDQKALEGALERLIAEPAFAMKLGKTAKEDSVQFTVDSVMTQWRKAIEG
ncbi:MAG: glycosyltransferase family 4 protein [Oscillospiraceae bacterium]|nr:glycosyltransferase family 4 protein [Oscillospiraceae bacterium]